MTSQTLFLAWQDQATTRRWFPIGRLDVDQAHSVYRFRYTHGAELARESAGFPPLPDFPKLDRLYKSDELFPIFQNRVMAPGRPDFAQYVEQLGLRPESSDPIEILAVSGGTRATDAFEVFPKLERQVDGRFTCRFFLHGSSHVSAPAQEKINNLTTGERLNVALELTNPATGLAVQVQTSDYFMIGWAPRYLVHDLAEAMARWPGGYEAEIVRLNPLPAPSKQRLLVEFRGKLPANYEPMSSEEFKPLVSCVPEQSEARP